ncbi:restriction endonuclease subunit S [Psychrobacter ciconiae]|uniref:restriction endonuclease subunit S n=1 Tax=Psychrobacter ciconiae TaxID=1553449 RepID=UPI0038792CBC
MFEKLNLGNSNKSFNKKEDTSTFQNDEFNIPLVNAKVGDNGIMFYGRESDFDTAEMTIDVISNGAIATGTVYAQPHRVGVLWDAYLLRVKNQIMTKQKLIYLASCLEKSIKLKFGWDNKAVWSKVQHEFIKLPTKNNQPDFEFMEQFIGQLEQGYVQRLDDYLSVTGLHDIELTDSERHVLADFESWEWVGVEYQEVFNHIVQGRRLKKEDQIEGDIPFVMAGITNTGVVGYISNPVASFPENSITVDIFGNTFYRNYAYGAGDDTGCYWNDEKTYSTQAMLFFTTAMDKSLKGRFDYGNKLRSSQSLNFEMQLPTTANQPDFSKMETLISALQKLVIREVVNYTDERLQVTEAFAC